MDTDKLSPGRGFLALGGWGNAVAFQDIPHGLIADAIAQVEQSTHNAIIPPRAVLSGHAHHKVFQLLVDAGTSHRWRRLCVGTRLDHKLAMPGENGLGLRDCRNFFQGFLAQLLAKHSQGGAFSVCQRYTARELVAQDAVFHRQVGIAQAKFLIHRSRAIRQELLPIHGSFHPSCCLSLVGSMGHTEMECKMRSERWEDGKEWENGVVSL